ncbi:MAG TPA: AAA family ATPase, partial [Polyangiaceae bacterium]|nr:AAA family ATPase [Polyangiaceae bacterium]
AGELAGLRRAFQRAAARSPGLVFLHGPSGIGKTVLLERFLQEARGLGALVFAGKCRERESVGYKAADGIVDDLVAWLDAMPGPEARRLLPADLADLVRLFPALRAAAPVALAPKPAFDTPDRGLVKRRAIAAFRELIEQAARRHPVVLGIDDLQWGDAGTADLLGPILDLDRPLPVLFVGSFRTTGDGRGPTLDALLASETVRLPEPIELRVRPLKPPDAEYLAARLLGDAHPEGGRLSRTIAREANGNPLFISELACFAQTPEQRPAAAGRASLSALVRLRFEALPKPARDLLELTAIAGGPIARGIVRRSAGIGAAEADRAVDLLRASRLARTQGTSDDDELDVHHDRVRELLLRSLPPAQRAHHHLTLAKVLESRPGAKPEMIAAHYQAGGDLGRAGQFWLRAADSAFSTLAFEHAARLYDEGLALAPLSHQERTGVQIRRAEALEYAGRAVASANGYLEAAEHVARDESVELRRRAAEQLLLAGHLERGLAVIHEVLASLGMRRPRTGAAALASIAWGRARVRLRGLRHRTRAERDLSSEELSRIDVSFGIACSLGVIDFVRGADFQNEHLLLALAAGEPKRVLRALTLEVAYAATPGLGSDARTRHVLELAERLALKLNDPAGRALVMLGRGVAAHLRGHVAAALSECEEALQIFTTRCRGAVWESITAQRFIVWSQFHLGDLSALARQVPPLVQQADAQGNLYAATFFRTSYCNSAWLVRDQVDTAREQLRRARREWTAPGVQLAHCWMLMGEALLDFYCGSYDAAHERIEAVWPEIVAAQLLRIGIMRTQLWYFRAASALAAAHRADAAGLRDRSRALLELAAEGARRLDREPLPFARPLAALLRGGLLAAAGALSSAVSVLRACSRDFEAQTFRFHAAGALVRAGQLLGGDEGDAWIARGAAAIAKEGVKNPLAMLRIVAPGFAEA